MATTAPGVEVVVDGGGGGGADEADVLTSLQSRFTVVDYCVFAFLLGVSAAIGLYFGFRKRQKTTADFLMGGRSMGTFPMAMSLIASFMSAIALLGTPAETYQHGTMYWIIGVAYIITMPAAAYLYFPVFYKLDVMSAYEYLDRRFNRFLRCLGSAIFTIQMTIYMAIVVYAPALALSQVTGINVYVSVTLIFIVCIFYCVAGGMKAVMWTDTVQVIIMYGALVAVVLKGVFDIGGFAAVWEANTRTGRVEFDNFSADPTVRHTWWSLVIGGYFTWIAIYGVNQAQVQRYLSVPNMKTARNALWINLLGLLILVSLCSYAGLVIYAKYQTCDPLKAKIVSTSDQLFPLFVMDTMGNYPGIPGVFVAGIFSGALSTVSSGVNSLAAITLEDFVKPFMFKNMTDEQQTKASRILSLIFGVISFGLVFVAELLGNVLQAALSIFGMIGGPLLGMFTLGMFFPWANQKGAVVGTLGGLAITFWIGGGAQVAKAYGYLSIPKKPVSTDGCGIFYEEQPFLQLKLNSSLARIMAAEMRMAEDLATHEPLFADGTTQRAFSDSVAGDDGGMSLLGLYGISYMWYSVIGCLAVVIIGMVVSLLTGLEDMSRMDPRLISPGTVFVMERLPKSMQKRLRWELGLNYDAKEAGTANLKESASKASIGLEFESSSKGEINFGMDHASSKSTVPSLMIPGIGGHKYTQKDVQEGDLHLPEIPTTLTMVCDDGVNDDNAGKDNSAFECEEDPKESTERNEEVKAKFEQEEDNDDCKSLRSTSRRTSGTSSSGTSSGNFSTGPTKETSSATTKL